MERNALVDKLKGYACFLVLFGHVIMGVRQAGVNIPQFFEGTEKFIWSFHVALFLFLSGVVYTLTGEWRSKGTRLRFMAHKFYTLGIPYVVFSAVYIAINSMVGQANTQSSLRDILFIWKTPVAQYWFLYALAFLFCIWAAFSGVIKNWLLTLIVVAVGYAVPLLGGSLGCFGVVFSSALAFGLGTAVNFAMLEKPPIWVKCAVIVAHIATSVALIVFGRIEDPFVKEVMIVFGIYASILFISLIQHCKPVARFLLFVNKYSFQIYLLHTIFTAGIRIVLLRVNVTQWWAHVLIGTAVGLAVSVLVAKIAEKVPLFNFFFFPAKAFSTKRKSK